MTTPTQLTVAVQTHGSDVLALRQVLITGKSKDTEIELSLSGGVLHFEHKLTDAGPAFEDGRTVQTIGLGVLANAWAAAIDTAQEGASATETPENGETVLDAAEHVVASLVAAWDTRDDLVGHLNYVEADALARLAFLLGHPKEAQVFMLIWAQNDEDAEFEQIEDLSRWGVAFRGETWEVVANPYLTPRE